MDVRLLSVVAETGRAAVHEIAGRLGMDVRDVAARLAALSTTGLPLIVGVECDPNGIRNALAAANAWTQAAQAPSGSHPASAGYPTAGSHPASGGYSVPPPHSGSHPVPNPPGAGYPVPPQPSGSYPQPVAPHPGQHVPQPFTPAGPPPTFGQFQVPAAPNAAVPSPTAPPDPVTTWGPPGSATWARGDQPPQGGVAPAQQRPPSARTGKIGSKLDVEGPEGEQVTIQLVEVVDPADFLFTAAGHQLRDGERSVVVHTEMTNRGAMPFTSLPDLYLELIDADGSAVAKAPVTLSSRPPHRIGLAPGETAGGHTVYVLPEATEITAVRWSPRRGDQQRTLTWDITDL